MKKKCIITMDAAPHLSDLRKGLAHLLPDAAHCGLPWRMQDHAFAEIEANMMEMPPSMDGPW
jgi:hypothetical protein